MNKKEEAEIDALLASIWSRSLPTLHERLNILDCVAAEAASGQITEVSRAQGLDISHKLSGSLGMFGYDQGTEIARRIEQILSSPTAATLNSLLALTTELRQTVLEK